MYNKSYRYTDPIFSSYGKKSGKPPENHKAQSHDDIKKTSKPHNLFPVSFDKLKNMNKDDYILLFLIFMLVKDNKDPDWPLIFSLCYILFDSEE